MDSSDPSALLQAEDAQYFIASQQLSPAMSRKLNASIHATYPKSQWPSDYSAKLSLFSAETYEFLGLVPEVAERLWMRWCAIAADDKEPDGPVGFLELATHHIMNQENNAKDTMADWYEVMRGWGVSEELIEGIMAPEFEDIRMTESAKTWVIESMDLRDRALDDMLEAGLERLQEPRAIEETERQPCNYNMSDGDSENREKELVNGPKGKEKEDKSCKVHTLLWRAFDKNSLERVRKTDGSLYLNGHLCSEIPSDLRGIKGSVLFFLSHRAVAEHYARFAKRRSPWSSIKLVCMRIPIGLFERYQPHVFQSDDDEWKQIVSISKGRCWWGCRLPEHLEHIREKHIFIGPICTNGDEAISNLDSWMDISETNVMILQDSTRSPQDRVADLGLKAIQYVFNSEAVQNALEEEAKLDIIDLSEPGPKSLKV